MTFKERYIEEMDNIEPSDVINKRLIAIAASENVSGAYMEFYKNNRALRGKRTVDKKTFSVILKHTAVAAAILGIVLVGANFDRVKAFASNLFGRFTLDAGGEKIELADIATLDFDEEKFLNSSNVKLSGMSDSEMGDNVSCYKDYTDIDELKTETNIDMIKFDSGTYSHILLSILPTYKNIHISSELIYNDKTYTLNAMACYGEAYEDDWGYGTDEKVIEKYEYATGENAYFVNQDGTVGLYFCIGDILYQLYFTGENESNAIEIGKDILDSIVVY